jgi:hypothetical protein
VLFSVCALCLKGVIAMAWPMSELAVAVIQGSFFAIAMICIGIIDIIMGVRIVRAKVQFPDLLKALGIITLIAGIAEATVFLGLLALPLAPVTCVLLGILLIKEKEATEFV